MNNEKVKGYKVLLPDWTSKHGLKYELGKTYGNIAEDELEPCVKGYHFCKKLVNCFNYYHFNPDNVVVEIEATGKVIEEGNKCVTNEIKIVKQIAWEKVIEMCNTGYCNTGYCNTGDRNTGYCNTGNCNTGDDNTGNCNTGYGNTGGCNTGDYNTGGCNTGDYNTGGCNTGDYNTGYGNTGYGNTGYGNTGNCNTGDRNTGKKNSGDWNSGDWNSGVFNTDTPKLRMFNKESDNWTYDDWLHSYARDVLLSMPMKSLVWVRSKDMIAEEKQQHPEHETTGGYFKKFNEEDTRQEWWNNLDKSDKEAVMNLPNFDKTIFKKITGIEVI